MRYPVIVHMLARLILISGGLLLLPAGVSWFYQEKAVSLYFLETGVGTSLVGLVLFIVFYRHRNEVIRLRDGFLLVTLSWLLISALGALPFYASGFFPSFIDAFFESVSGFTTTGASVLRDIEALPRGLLFWRSFTHWIGGMGIIVLAIAILPQLSVGGMQLMKNEMPGPTFEQLQPRIKQTALSLWKVYILFSVLLVLILYLLGMPLFDSFCHMFGTLGTGGFSTKNLSIGYYQSPAIEMTIAVFMFLAGINFVLHYAALHFNFKKMFCDSEWRFYIGLSALTFLIITADLILQGGIALSSAARISVFQISSIITTTGYVTADFDRWPQLSKGILFLLMIVGGCAGSTAGGLKQVRLLLLFKKAKQAIVQHVFPNAVVSVKMNNRAIPENIMHGVSSFLLLYLVIFSFATLCILAFNIDFVTATSSVIACLSNVGPGFAQVGAVQNYAFFHPLLKALLCFCMIIGRLELFTILVLFFRDTWRR